MNYFAALGQNKSANSQGPVQGLVDKGWNMFRDAGRSAINTAQQIAQPAINEAQRASGNIGQGLLGLGQMAQGAYKASPFGAVNGAMAGGVKSLMNGGNLGQVAQGAFDGGWNTNQAGNAQMGQGLDQATGAIGSQVAPYAQGAQEIGDALQAGAGQVADNVSNFAHNTYNNSMSGLRGAGQMAKGFMQASPTGTAFGALGGAANSMMNGGNLGQVAQGAFDGGWNAHQGGKAQIGQGFGQATGAMGNQFSNATGYGPFSGAIAAMRGGQTAYQGNGGSAVAPQGYTPQSYQPVGGQPAPATSPQPGSGQMQNPYGNQLPSMARQISAPRGPSQQDMSAFKSIGGYDPNSWIDRNKMQLRIQGDQNWSDNNRARQMGQVQQPWQQKSGSFVALGKFANADLGSAALAGAAGPFAAGIHGGNTNGAKGAILEGGGSLVGSTGGALLATVAAILASPRGGKKVTSRFLTSARKAQMQRAHAVENLKIIGGIGAGSMAGGATGGLAGAAMANGISKEALDKSAAKAPTGLAKGVGKGLDWIGSKLRTSGGNARLAAQAAAGPAPKMTTAKGNKTRAGKDWQVKSDQADLAGSNRRQAAGGLDTASNKINSSAGLQRGINYGGGALAASGGLYGANRLGHSSGMEDGVAKGYDVGVQDATQAAAASVGNNGLLERLKNLFTGGGGVNQGSVYSALADSREKTLRNILDS